MRPGGCSEHAGLLLAQHGTAAKDAQDEFQQNNSPRTQGCGPAAPPEGFPSCFTPLRLSKDALGTRGNYPSGNFLAIYNKKGKDRG